MLVAVVVIAAVPPTNAEASSASTSIVLEGQIGIGILNKQIQSPIPLSTGQKCVLGIDTYHVKRSQMYDSFNMVMKYAWIFYPTNPLTGIPIPLAIYVDNYNAYQFLRTVFANPATGQTLFPIILARSVNVHVGASEQHGILSIESKVTNSGYLAILAYIATRQQSSTLTSSLTTPTGFAVTVTANPGKMAQVIGVGSDFYFATGFGVASTFTLTITLPTY